MTQLKSRVAFVTGSGTGIGKATAIAFAREGAKVAVATRTAESGQQVVDQILSEGGEAILIQTKLGSRPEVGKAVSQTVDAFGSLDIALHNAAIIEPLDVRTMDEAALERTLDVNLKAAFWIAGESFDHLARSDAGRLLFTSSIIGVRQMMAGFAPYGATKGAINSLIGQLGYEWAPTGVTVNGIEPGFILTERFREYLSDEMLEASVAMIPRGQAGTPEDIANAFVFLASPKAGHITGQTLIVDGGQALGHPMPKD